MEILNCLMSILFFLVFLLILHLGNLILMLPMYNGQVFKEVHKALKNMDPRKAPGLDLIEPYFLNLVSHFIAKPLTYIYIYIYTNIVA